MAQSAMPDGLESGNSAIVARVEAPFTLVLDDGRKIQLGGLELPESIWRERAAGWLEDQIVGQQVTPHLNPAGQYGRSDRYGRILAQTSTDEGIWLQQALLENGLARVQATAEQAGSVPPLYEFEDTARRNKRGIWADERFAVRNATSIHDHMFSEEIVEAPVLEAKSVHGRIYLNFGDDWKTDFTVVIAKGDVRKFTAAGLSPLEWAGRTIRVRGWVKSYNGPMIEVTHPIQIEMLEPATNYNPG